MDFKCPTCKKVIPSPTSKPDGKKQLNAPFFPFCSHRCRLVDLGHWLDGGYRIPAAERPLDDAAEWTPDDADTE